jgi:hypothetical protein
VTTSSQTPPLVEEEVQTWKVLERTKYVHGFRRVLKLRLTVLVRISSNLPDQSTNYLSTHSATRTERIHHIFVVFHQQQLEPCIDCTPFLNWNFGIKCKYSIYLSAITTYQIYILNEEFVIHDH